MAKKTRSATEPQVPPEHPSPAEQKMPAEPQAGERTRSGRTFRPRVDICETDGGLMLLADMPGAKPEGLTITLDRRVLNVHAAVEEHAPEGYSSIYHEYELGDFECDFTLSGDFDADKIEASLTNGVLRLTIPELNRPKPGRSRSKRVVEAASKYHGAVHTWPARETNPTYPRLHAVLCSRRAGNCKVANCASALA